jgi:hypothetical protein
MHSSRSNSSFSWPTSPLAESVLKRSRTDRIPDKGDDLHGSRMAKLGYPLSAASARCRSAARRRQARCTPDRLYALCAAPDGQRRFDGGLEVSLRRREQVQLLCRCLGDGETGLGYDYPHPAREPDRFVGYLVQFPHVACLKWAYAVAVLLFLRAVIESPEERL